MEVEREDEGDVGGSEVEDEDETAAVGVVVSVIVAVSVLAQCGCLASSISASSMNAIDAGASFWLFTSLCSSWVCLLSGMKSK